MVARTSGDTCRTPVSAGCSAASSALTRLMNGMAMRYSAFSACTGEMFVAAIAGTSAAAVLVIIMPPVIDMRLLSLPDRRRSPGAVGRALQIATIRSGCSYGRGRRIVAWS